MGLASRERRCREDAAYLRRCRLAHELAARGVPRADAAARLGVCERTARRMARTYEGLQVETGERARD